MMKNAADDAIAKRRAELRRLQQQRGKSAGIAERLSQQAHATTLANNLNPRRAAAPMMMRSAVTNNNSRFGVAAAAASSSMEVGGNARLTTARRLDESYNTTNHHLGNNGVAAMNNNNTTAANASYGPTAASQKLTSTNRTQATMAVKRTSEIFPPNASSKSSSMVRQQHPHNRHTNNVAPPAAMPSTNITNNMTMGSTKNNSHQYQQVSPPVVQQTTISVKAPPKQQYPQYHQQQSPSTVVMTNSHNQSPSLNSIQSTSSYTSTSNKSSTTTATTTKSSPFGQARVTKVIPALSLSGSSNNGSGGGGIIESVKSLVPPLNMLDPPLLVDDDKAVGKSGGGAVNTATATVDKKKVPLKRVGDTTKLLLKKDNGVTTVKNDKMTTPRQHGDDGEVMEAEVINSGQSTPIHTNCAENSPLESVVDAPSSASANNKNGGSTKAGDDGSKSQAAAVLPDVSATLQEAKMALAEQQVDDAKTTAVTTENDSRPKELDKEEKGVENHQPPQSTKEVKNGSTNNGKKNINLSLLKLDLERSEKEKLEALEQVARLKSLLEAGGVGRNGNNGETSSSRSSSLEQMSTIDSPRRGTTPRNGGGGFFGGGNTTPRGGGTPNRFTPGRGGRAGVPPLAWGSPRSGNSRADSRSGSPERGHHHHHPYGLMMSGTPRVRASPLPKQFNRVISDTKLNKKTGGGDDADGGAAATPREERVEEEFLSAAARSIPNEYGTPLASYFVRRPHVTDDSLDQNETDELAKVAIDLWGNNKCTHLSSGDEYKKNASVFKPESLEIVACIEADGSVFTLSGECNARHGKVSTVSSGFDEDDVNIAGKEYEWSVFDNVEEMDRALGRVSYIDEEGNEREYWLDSIYEEALTTRESYCTSMISAAFTLKEVRGPLAQKREQSASWNQRMQSQPMPMQSFAPPKSTLDGSVKMSRPPLNQQHVPQSNANVPQNQSQRSEPLSKVEMPTNPAKKVPVTSESASKASSSKEETKQKQSPPPEEYEPSDSALTVMVVALFSFFFKLSWLVIKTPFRIASMILTFWIMLIAVRVLCLFLADDNGAWDIGAGVEYEYNMPGIY